MNNKFFLLFLGIIIFFGEISFVDALEVEELNPTIQVGETKNIDLYVNVPADTERVDFLLSFLSYDVIGTFESAFESITINGTSHSITFVETITGRKKLGEVKIKVSDSTLINTSNVNLYNAIAVSKDGVKTKLNTQSIQVKVEKKQDENNLLKSINSNIVDIPFKYNEYEYEVLVSNKVDKLDLVAIAKDETYTIDITEQTLKIGRNQIFITVSKGNISEKYTINVIREDFEEKKEVLDESKDKIEKNATVIKKENVSDNKKNFKFGWNIIIICLVIAFIIGLCLLKKK